MPAVIPRLIAEVFEHVNFGGRRACVFEPVEFTTLIGFQDNISSVKVYKGPGFRSSPNYKAIFHQHRGFQGKKLALGPGFYPNLHDVIYNFPDSISSISFGSMLETTGPEWGTVPVVVECYEHVDYGGRKITILRDIAHTGDLGIHDSISSIKIFKGPDFPSYGTDIHFFEHIDFEGAKLSIRMEPSEYKKEIPNLHVLPQNFADMISSVKIEGWSSSSEFTELVFDDEFIGNDMRPEWKWVDPGGGGSWSERQGYLEMRAEPGQDLWHGSPSGQGGDMDAPRLLMEVEGDFAIECRLRVSPDLREHGGLVVWKSPNAFVRLEKTSGPHGFRGDVRFERHVNRQYSLVGRGPGLRNVRELYLRLERRGNQFLGYASSDGTKWVSCGQTNVGMGNPVQIGMHTLCPGNIPPTLTRFEYFRLFKRKMDATEFMYHQANVMRGGRVSDREFQSRRADLATRALRDIN